MRREHIFQDELRKSAINVGKKLWWRKIPDVPYKTEAGLNVSPKKPFDVHAVFAGYSFAIELKADAEIGKGFNTQCLAHHQWEGLQHAREAGMLPMVLFNRRYGTGQSRVNLAWELPLDFLEPYRGKIVPLDVIQSKNNWMEYMPHDGWPISAFLNRSIRVFMANANRKNKEAR